MSFGNNNKKYGEKSTILPVLSIICDYKEATFRINNIFTEASKEFPFRTSADTFRKIQVKKHKIRPLLYERYLVYTCTDVFVVLR